MDRWRIPLLPVLCGGCQKSGDSHELSKCGKCRLVTYCSRECQVNAWPLHKLYCKRACQQNPQNKSFLKLAKDCARALRCFEHLKLNRSELHPTQQARMDALQEALEFISVGQLPPKALMPCLLNCGNTAPDLIDYEDERELREYVISGLCARCQVRAWSEVEEFAGPEESTPPSPPPPHQPVAMWMGSEGRWMPLFEGAKLITDTTVWEEGEEQRAPLWVAGETVVVKGLWEQLPGGSFYASESVAAQAKARSAVTPFQRGDGEVVLVGDDSWASSSLPASQLPTRAVPMRTLRALIGLGTVRPAFAIALVEARGAPIRPVMAIADDGDDPPPLVFYVMLTRILGLNMNNMMLQSRLSPDMRAMKHPAVAATLQILTSEGRMREQGTYEAMAARMVPPRRVPVPVAAAAQAGAAAPAAGTSS